MNNYVNAKQDGLKCKMPILILAIFGLFLYFVRTGIMLYLNRYLNFSDFSADLLLNFLLDIAIPIVPFIMFLISIIMCFKKPGLTRLGYVTFGVIAAEEMISLLANYMVYKFKPDAMSLTISIITIVLFALAMIETLYGFKKKYFLITAISYGVVVYIYYFIRVIRNLTYYIKDYQDGYYYDNLVTLVLYYLPSFLSILAHIILFIALLLFGINSSKNLVLSGNDNNMQTMYTGISEEERILNLLKERYEQGYLSEEEYQAQRAEIIKSL